MNDRLTPGALATAELRRHTAHSWDDQILAQLQTYISIPAKSPAFDADWLAHGYLERVVRDAADWILARKVPGLQLEV